MLFILAIFLRSIINQKEKRGFTWHKIFIFYFKDFRIFIQKKEVLLGNTRSTYLKENLCVAASVYLNREASQGSTYFL